MRRRKPLVSPAEWRLFWLITLGLSVVGGGGTAAYLVLNKPEEPKNLLPSQSPFDERIDDTIPDSLSLSDFLLPAPGGQWLTRSWMFSRQAGRAWTPEEVQPYWTPVTSLPITQLPSTNDARMARFFEDLH